MYARTAVIRRLGFLVFGLAMVVATAGCPPTVAQPRPPGTDGSARWAWAIAQPVITGIAADAQLRTVIGAAVQVDGRLPANTGNWSFVAWSPTHSTIQVTVSAAGTTSTTQRNDAAPGPGIQVPLPATWADSTQVFAATNGKRDPGASSATLVVLNIASYSQAPGQAVWGIAFNVSPNQLVKFDGTYIGPQ